MQIISGLGLELSARSSPEIQPIDVRGGNSFEEYLKQAASPPSVSPSSPASAGSSERVDEATSATWSARQSHDAGRAAKAEKADAADAAGKTLRSESQQEDEPPSKSDKTDTRQSKARNGEGSRKNEDGDDNDGAVGVDGRNEQVPDRISAMSEEEAPGDEMHAAFNPTRETTNVTDDRDGLKSSSILVEKGSRKDVGSAGKDSPLKEKVSLKEISFGEKKAVSGSTNADGAEAPERALSEELSIRDVVGNDMDGETTEGSRIGTGSGTDAVTAGSKEDLSARVMGKISPDKVQLQRENSKGIRSRDVSRSAFQGSEKEAATGKTRGVHEIELDLTDEAVQDLVKRGQADGDEVPLSRDDTEREGTSFLARMEQPTVAQSHRQIGTHQAAGTLAKRLNGDLGSNIVRQAKIMLSESDKAEIRLIIRPPELGRVRINLQMENGHIAGRILVDNGSVREVVEQNLPALQRAFAEAGLDVGSFEVATGDSRQEAGSNGDRNGSTGNGRRSSEGAGAFSQSIESIEVNDYGHRRINLVA